MPTSISWAVLACAGLITLSACGATTEQSGAPIAGSARQTSASLAASPDGAIPATEIVQPQSEGPIADIIAQTAELNARACEIDERSMQTAVDVHFADTGTYPESEQALVVAGYLGAESDGQDVLPGGVVVPGPRCIGVGEPTGISIPEPSPRNQCKISSLTLEVAREAFFAETGAYPATEDQLIPGYMTELSADYDIAADGSIAAAPGGACVQ